MNPLLIDSHCHVHWKDFAGGSEAALDRARAAGVGKLICVGTDVSESIAALEFAQAHDGVFASAGIHPHEAKHGIDGLETILIASHNKVQPCCKVGPCKHHRKLVAIGECGLDYHYNHSSTTDQKAVFKAHIALAQKYDLPLIFHVREAYDDFWPIFDEFYSKKPLRGVVHSFSDSADNLQKALDRHLFMGVNGIATFTKSNEQQAMFAAIPLARMLLETDAPYLTPAPVRGSMNEPGNIRHIAGFVAGMLGISIEEVAKTTSRNVEQLFHI